MKKISTKKTTENESSRRTWELLINETYGCVPTLTPLNFGKHLNQMNYKDVIIDELMLMNTDLWKFKLYYKNEAAAKITEQRIENGISGFSFMLCEKLKISDDQQKMMEEIKGVNEEISNDVKGWIEKLILENSN